MRISTIYLNKKRIKQNEGEAIFEKKNYGDFSRTHKNSTNL